jgi:NAD(P)-dependent dehydrogenase (short-subunit alcohol dehydrogenase family)
VLPAAATPRSIEHFDQLKPDVREALVEKYKGWVPLGGRFGTVDQISPLYVCLGSDAASFLTGQMIAANGGWTMPR